MTYTPPARTAVDFVITAYTKPDISGRANELSVYTIPSLTAVNFAISSYTLPVFNRVNFELEQAQGVTGTLAVTGYLAPEIFYPRPKKKVEEDEAIAMVLISLLDEAW